MAENPIRVLCVGDVVGGPGRKAVALTVPRLKAERKLAAVIACAENCAGGNGVTPQTAQELFDAGCDVLTGGNHIWRQKELLPYWDLQPRLLRGANYPPGVPGRGSVVLDLPGGFRLAVINLEGRVFMQNLDCPFRAMDRLLDELRGQTDAIIVDFHAEATSEKRALGWYLDGRVTALVGTHTHVQTADEEVLPGGTAYLTDLGMTGPFDSVIGMRKEVALKRFMTQLPQPFQVAKGQVRLQGAIIEIDPAARRAVKITRVSEDVVAA